MAKVVVDIEERVVDPDSAVLKGNPHQLLAIARNPVEPTLERAPDLTEIDSAALACETAGLIDSDSGHMKWGMRTLGDEKAVVLGGQAVKILVRQVDPSAIGVLGIKLSQ
jgi:hypothetical protein